MKKLDAFFYPKSIAIIGASNNPTKLGHIVLKNFVDNGFRGDLFPINPKVKEILGLKSYSSISRVPKPVDHAIILVPAEHVLKVVDQCGRKKVKAVTIISSGFKESDEAGVQREEQLKILLFNHKMRLIGPNCLGVYVPSTKVDHIFLPTYRLGRPKHGSIAILSQSGAFGSSVLDWAAEQDIGISKFVSYGNAADVDEIDLFNYLADDKDTKVISIYLEGANRPKKIIPTAKKIVGKKPILVFKAGSSQHGQRAVQSHTGSLAGADKIYSAAFKQCGMIRVFGIEDLFDCARALSMQPLPKGNRIAIITDGGGFGIMATDTAEKEGLEIAELSKETQQIIKRSIPSFGSAKNPVDLTGSADGKMYGKALEACLADPNIDGVVLILLFQPPHVESDVVDSITSIHSKSKKPLVICSTGGRYTQVHREILDQAGIPTYPTPERAVRAMSVLYDYSLIKKRFAKHLKNPTSKHKSAKK